MKILLTGSVQSFADKKGTVVLEVLRKAKEGPVAETFYLKFHQDDAYQEFKSRYVPGDGVQVIGLVRQIQTPLVDRETKKPIAGAHGRDLRNTLLAVEVREHKKIARDEADTIYAHGLVGVVSKEEMRQSASGVSYVKLRVAYNHFKRPDESEGQADFYNLVAFGRQAESLDNMEKGDKFVIDYAIMSHNPYEMREISHSDGTAITRNSPELVLKEFSYLPRSRQAGEPIAQPVGEEIPF